MVNDCVTNPDLAVEMRKLVLEPKRRTILPTEILKEILQKLDYKSLSFARQTCKHWEEIVAGFKLMEKATSKFIETFVFIYDSK